MVGADRRQYLPEPVVGIGQPGNLGWVNGNMRLGLNAKWRSDLIRRPLISRHLQ